ncbi:hypothetical protein, partial [Vibrio parahaemolyticus]|uniref:hypothetical protein n=1 Tax=Vibrio parahaemolyticus TaxID=670 RepID=UPI001EEA39F0
RDTLAFITAHLCHYPLSFNQAAQCGLFYIYPIIPFLFSVAPSLSFSGWHFFDDLRPVARKLHHN